MKQSPCIWILFCLLGLTFANAASDQDLDSNRRLVAEDEEENDTTDVEWMPEPAPANGSRIAYGEPVTSGKYPFAAYIYGRNFQCSGSLISRKVLASAAHCVYGKNGWTTKVKDVRIRIGNPNVKEAKEFRVKSITLPKYNPYTNYGDISLFELTKAAPYKPIALPTSSFKLYQATRATVIGWGQMQDGKFPFRMHSARMTLLTSSQCNMVHKLAFGMKTVKDHICLADTDKQGTCEGDSGGPYFVTRGNGQPLQIGVVSYGPGNYKCGQYGNLDVPTSMTYWAPWVRRTIKKYKMW